MYILMLCLVFSCKSRIHHNKKFPVCNNSDFVGMGSRLSGDFVGMGSRLSGDFVGMGSRLSEDFVGMGNRLSGDFVRMGCQEIS
jgi:hypothetical protein